VRYANFLAAGNAPIEVPLNTHQSTLIVGRNGSGKSTVTEAITFALFGRPLRGVNKSKLVNSINQRDCLVELDFSVGVNTYKIRRGIKPTIFEVYENGKLIPAPASIADYQTILESNILRLSFKTFQQVVILGSTSYVPFMRLTPGARRDIIESFLDIEVFSAMNAMTKEEAAQVKIDLDKCLHTQRLLSEQHKMAQSFTQHIEEQREHALNKAMQALTTERATIAALEQERADHVIALSEYDADKEAYNVAVAKEQEYVRTLDAITLRERKLKKERTFYADHDNCPTCEQSITADFKTARFDAINTKELAAMKAHAQCEALITKYRTRKDAAAERITEANAIERKIHAIDAKLPLHRRRVRELEAECEVQRAPVEPAEHANIDELERQIQEAAAEQEVLVGKRIIIDAASMLLRDNGIKARIVRHYLPIINRTINHYLNALDFPILFELDEEFNETIKSRHRDDFAYDSFSEGEKKRIDLALLLTWRAVARLKNSAATNLLVLDEVFDSSLDAAGTEEFLKVIANLEADTNVFTISHKTDQLVDKFEHSITFEKVRGFSQIKV
jgi:DNA repair exonuclease SbcCD ATPase subunit